jgi:hypothetical protein
VASAYFVRGGLRHNECAATPLFCRPIVGVQHVRASNGSLEHGDGGRLGESVSPKRFLIQAACVRALASALEAVALFHDGGQVLGQRLRTRVKNLGGRNEISHES